MRDALALVLARLAGAASRRLGRGQGGTISGRIFLALATPAGARRLARRPTSAVVTGTNGKTTTTTLIAGAAARTREVATNASGANLIGGVFGGLLERPHAPTAILEVDELALPAAVEIVQPDVIALLNLSRDQLDRVQEVRRTAALWHDVLAGFEGAVVVNADDPLLVWAARSSSDVVWVAAGQPWLADATACPACTSTITVDTDGWRCDTCDLRRPATPTLDGQVPPTGLPGRCNQANAAVAAAVLDRLGVDRADAAAWTDVTSVAGRYEHATVGGTDVRLLLAKNPAGWLETLKMLDPDRRLIVALNARIEDGTDPSWIWDVPFEVAPGTTVVCAGERATDMAVRLEYAGATAVVDRDVVAAVGREPTPVDVVANYSAFRQLRPLLLHRG